MPFSHVSCRWRLLSRVKALDSVHLHLQLPLATFYSHFPDKSALHGSLVAFFSICSTYPLEISGTDVLPVTQPTMSKYWRKIKAVTQISGLASSFFIHRWTSEGRAFPGPPTPVSCCHAILLVIMPQQCNGCTAICLSARSLSNRLFQWGHQKRQHLWAWVNHVTWPS